MSFDCAAYIDNLNMFGIRLGLDATKNLMERAGHPEKSLRFIHIAGTNGKGSVAAMLERSLRAAGLKTGLYTSPHLIDVRERFRIDGKAVSKTVFDRAGEALARAAEGGNFSYFEFATVLAMKIFAEAGCGVVLWETGMGGRLDATNAVTPEVTVITNIAFDHQAHLGNTLGAIATEKAGILKTGVPLFHGRLPQEALEAITRRANELGVPVTPPRAAVPETATAVRRDGKTVQRFVYDGKTIDLALPGKMQRENFRIVYEILTYLAPRRHFDLDAALAALSDVSWPARFQQIGGKIILDGGHNPDGVGALVEAVREFWPGEKFSVIYAAFADKHAENCIPLLNSISSHYFFTALGAEGRASFDDERLLKIAQEAGIPAEIVPCPADALKQAQALPQRIIISGSLYLAGTMLSLLVPQETVLDL